MDKKLAVLILICFVGVSAVLAAKPETPSVFDAIADLQASVSSLWTNATEQQSAIDAIEPGSTVHLGAWEYNDPSTEQPYGFSTEYHADTDGFVCAYLFNPTVDVVRLHAWTMPETSWKLRASTSVHPGESGSLMIPVRAGENWIVFGLSTGGTIIWIPLVP